MRLGNTPRTNDSYIQGHDINLPYKSLGFEIWISNFVRAIKMIQALRAYAKAKLFGFIYLHLIYSQLGAILEK
jgi:hypothetical protein